MGRKGLRSLLALVLFAFAFVLIFTTVQVLRAVATPWSGADETALAPQALLAVSKTAADAVVKRSEPAEFTVVVTNTSQAISILDVTVSDPIVPDCTRSIGNLGPGEERVITCSKLNVQQAFTNEVFVEGVNANSSQIEAAADTATIDVIDLDITLLFDPESMPEPGGPVQFDLTAVNSGSVELTLTSLTSPQYGNLFDGSNDLVGNSTCMRDVGNLPILAANGDTFDCTFEADVNSQPPEFSVVLTAVAEDSLGNSIARTAEAVIAITDETAVMDVTLTVNPATISAPGGTVTFQLVTQNSSTVDTLNILGLSDSILGNLDSWGDCTVPQVLIPGSEYVCSYSYELTALAGSTRQHTVSVSAEDDDNPPGSITKTDTATIQIVEPPSYSTWLPVLVFELDEDNDRCNEAYAIQTDQPYFFFADDEEDWYYFELAFTQAVTVELMNFVPREGQVIVYRGQSCSILSDAIGNDGSSDLDREIKLGSQPAGRYYVLIVNDGLPNDSEPYELSVRTQ